MAFMPMAMMFLPLIPDGAESTVFALITTWLNIGSDVSMGIGAVFDCALPNLTNTDLKNGNRDGIVILAWISACVQLVPLGFVYFKYRHVECVPNGRRETRAQFDPERTCQSGVLAFACIFAFGSLFTALMAFLVVAYPHACV